MISLESYSVPVNCLVAVLCDSSLEVHGCYSLVWGQAFAAAWYVDFPFQKTVGGPRRIPENLLSADRDRNFVDIGKFVVKDVVFPRDESDVCDKLDDGYLVS